MTSSSDQIGERSAVKVLADGTVIKVQASGVGADDFAGYPTTFPANPEAGPPQPAAQSIAQLTAIADAVANAVLAHR